MSQLVCSKESALTSDIRMRCAWFFILLLMSAGAIHAQDDSLPPRSQWRMTSSSTEVPTLAPKFAIDGDPTTKWGGPFSAGHWLQIDLGRPADLGGVVLHWDLAF